MKSPLEGVLNLQLRPMLVIQRLDRSGEKYRSRGEGVCGGVCDIYLNFSWYPGVRFELHWLLPNTRNNTQVLRLFRHYAILHPLSA